MASAFSDHFSSVAGGYAAFRPRYPAALFSFLGALARRHQLAWDCGAGSGQASADLAAHFRHVIATDLSADQIAAAPPQPSVEYRVASAEASGLEGRSVDLVAVAQALHWFDSDRFHAEVRRVAAPGAVIAAWTYGLQQTGDAALDGEMGRYYHEVVGSYWPPERRHVESGYRTLAFPFEELAAPAFEMTAMWTLAELLGYVRTWSASSRYAAAQGHDPAAALAERIAPLWGPEEARRRVAWPLALRVGIV